MWQLFFSGLTNGGGAGQVTATFEYFPTACINKHVFKIFPKNTLVPVIF